MLKIFLKVSLLAIIPLAIFGFGVFEKTEVYSTLFKFKGVELAIAERLVTNFGDPKRLVITREKNPVEFDDLWHLIKNNTQYSIPNWNPKIISRIAVENGTFVTLPDKGKVVLVPRNVPVIAIKESVEAVSRGEATKEDWFMVGTIADIEEWLKGERAGLRFIFDLSIALFSIGLGIIVEFILKD